MSDQSAWYGKQGNMVMCPYPGCHHTGSFISKVHCRMHHDMEREEVGEKYGYPKQLNSRWSFKNTYSAK